jgi:hypothetical protein
VFLHSLGHARATSACDAWSALTSSSEYVLVVGIDKFI